ncbi:MAG TPA: AAA family ATPase [Rickettsiales bacterium]|nr:AAA family ATPase [Rickettsiales bacterium]
MNTQSQVMLIVLHEADTEFACQIADRGDGIAPHLVIGTPIDAIEEFTKRPFSPDYLLIDVGERSHDVLPEIDTIAEYCEVGTRVVVLGTVNDVSFYRELKSRGVSEYFTKPANPSEVRTILYFRQPAKSGAKGQVISFMSAASGDGASTIALNTAYALATEYNKSVVLVDMDYQFGMIAKNLDLATQFGIKELFDNPARGIDSTLIEHMILAYKNSKLKIIAAPNQLHHIPDVPEELISSLISTLSSDYDFVLLDLPHIWNNLTHAALTQSSHTVMVAQLWLRSITHSSRLLTAWRKAGMKDSQISLVANRSGAKFKEAVSFGDFERICGLPFKCHFDNDTKSVIAAENNGRTILEGGASDLSRQFKRFAGLLGGESNQPQQSATAEPAASGSVKSRLAGIMGKK